MPGEKTEFDLFNIPEKEWPDNRIIKDIREDNISDFPKGYYEKSLGLTDEQLLAINQRGGKIVDLGAGEMSFAESCHDDLGINVYAVEPNFDKLPKELQERLIAKLGPDHIIKDRAEDLKSLPDASAELVLTNHGALSYGRNKLELIVMLKEALRILASGGELRMSPAYAGSLIIDVPAAPGGLDVRAINKQNNLLEYFRGLLESLKISEDFEVVYEEISDLKVRKISEATIIIRKKAESEKHV